MVFLMHPLDVQKVLESFVCLRDSREQDTPRAHKRYEAIGVPVEVAKLNYGDYCAQCILPDGRKLYDTSKPIAPLCTIERKFALDELAQCFTTGRERFKREFERAKETGARIYLLVENGSIESLLNGKYRSLFNSNAFIASVTAYMVRYNMNLLFVKEELSGRMIKEILYRDLKERLERGDFDEI